MPRSFLQLVQAACAEMALQQPTTVIGNPDQTTTQLLALCQREGAEFFKEETLYGGWSVLRTDYTFNMVPGQTVYPLPADYGWFLPESIWDKNFRWQLLGPLSPQEWNVLQYGITPLGPRTRFQIRGTSLYLNPAPGVGQTDTVGLSYQSTAWAKSSGGVPQGQWLADTDTYRLDEDSLILGLIWRFFKAKGFATTDGAYEDYRRCVDTIKAREAGGRTLPLNSAASMDINIINSANVPDTGFGS